MTHEWEVWRSRISRSIGGRLGIVAFDASVDTGYQHVAVELSWGFVIGPWRYSFHWAVMA